jgi:hypothetical protein
MFWVARASDLFRVRDAYALRELKGNALHGTRNVSRLKHPLGDGCQYADD